MNFALLWLEALVILLLWLTVGLAAMARVPRRWLRRVLVGVAFLIPLGWLVPLVALTAKLGAGEFRLENGWFNYATALLAAYVIGAAVILHRGRQRRGDSVPAAASWRRGWLAFAWLIAVMLGYTTVSQMDLAARTRSALLYADVNSRYLTTLPAVISEDQNAAPIYAQAFARLKKKPQPDVDLYLPDDVEKANTASPSIDDYLERNTETVLLLRRAASMPSCRYEQDMTTVDIDAPMPELGSSRDAANLLALHARNAVAHGQLEEAVADITAIFRMSRHMGSRQSLVAALVGIGIDAIGIDTLQTVLPAVKDPRELDGLQWPSSAGRMFRNALVGEERSTLAAFTNMPGGLPANTNAGLTMPIPAPKTLSAALFRIFLMDEQTYISMIEGAQEMALQPYFKVRDKLNARIETGNMVGLMTSIVTPSIYNSIKMLAQIEASEACAHAAIAMTRYRLDHGSLPSKLSELVPKYLDAIPTDPFDGQPLRLAIKGNDRIIYSVGPDGVDDHGADMYAKGAHNKGDVIFTLKPHLGPP